MINIVFLTFLISANYSFSCDWEVINFEAETKIYNITPMNESELVSYSYDGNGNMFYQYSSDNGSSWEVIREENYSSSEPQPQKVVNVLKVNENTILFFRFYTQVLSFNIDTKQWDSTYTKYKGSSSYRRAHYIDNGKLLILETGFDEDNNSFPVLHISDTTNPLDFSDSRLFEESDPRNSPYVNYLGFNNDLLYYWFFDKSGIYKSINTYNIYTKKTDSLLITNEIQYIVDLIFYNDGIYFTNFKFRDSTKSDDVNDGFYKYNSETNKAELLYKFNHNYYGAPSLEELDEDIFSLRINSKYYTFKNDVFQKIVEVPGISCEECEDRKELFSYNKFNNYFYYTTRGSCLFRSDEFYKQLISETTSVVEIPNLDSDYYIEYYDLQGNKMRNAIVDSDLPNGLYLKAFRDNNNVISKTEKLIITK